jgi:L-ascorbate peroxidase
LTAGYSSLNGPYYPASGGADGSLLLPDEEISRQINDPMQNFRGFLLDKHRKYQARNVSAADFVQAAGNIGVKSCPGGPIVKTVSSHQNEEKLHITNCRYR